jgi:hypothetical protein
MLEQRQPQRPKEHESVSESLPLSESLRVCQNLRERHLRTYHLTFNLRDFGVSQHADAKVRPSQPNNQVRRERSRAESTK